MAKHTTIWKSYGMYSLKEMEQAEQDARENLKENGFTEEEKVRLYEYLDRLWENAKKL